MASRSLDEIGYPKTADEYWLLAEHHADALCDLIASYHPSYRRTIRTGHKITAVTAERVCEAVRKQIQAEE